MSHRILALDYMRILGMLAVLGIHVGALTINNPHFPLTLFVLYEVFSRYGIPIFFFISGFGLFRKINLNERFAYGSFLKGSTFKLVVTYVGWCVFYQIYFMEQWEWTPILESVFSEEFFYAVTCGYAGYHLYFMLLLIVFYLLMPIWVQLLKLLVRFPIVGWAVLLIFQPLFNIWAIDGILPIGSPWADNYLKHQLNWICLYYLATFMAGAYLGNNSIVLIPRLLCYRKYVYTFFVCSVLYLVYNIYTIVYVQKLEFVALAYTLHQLSWAGWLYCSSFILTSFIVLKEWHPPEMWQKFLLFLSSSSNIVYFLHPVFLDQLARWAELNRIVITAKYSLLFYAVGLCGSLGIAFLYQIGKKVYRSYIAKGLI